MLSPALVTVSNTADFTFAGSGKLSGQTSLVKEGSGTLTLATANDYSGTTVIEGGTVTVGTAAALGSIESGTVITNTGQLDLNGIALGANRSSSRARARPERARSSIPAARNRTPCAN